MNTSKPLIMHAAVQQTGKESFTAAPRLYARLRPYLESVGMVALERAHLVEQTYQVQLLRARAIS